MLPSLTKGLAGCWQSDTYLQYEENTNKSREMSIDNTVFKSTLVAPIGEHMLSFGVEGKHESLEDKTSNKISSRTHISNTQWAGFIEDEWALAEQFRLTFGGRLDHDKTTAATSATCVWRMESRSSMDSKRWCFYWLPCTAIT